MLNKFKLITCLLVIAMIFTTAASGDERPAKIKIGINAPITGEIPKVGEKTKFAAELWLKDVRRAGGLSIGEKKYPVELVIADNGARADQAMKANARMITEDKVMIIIGPLTSKQAVPAGGVADNLKTPMISPWSTNPNLTKNRPFVFRACFLDPFQGPVLARFIRKEFGFTKAAALYDVTSDYPRSIAKFFKRAWQRAHGRDSIAAFESFTHGETNFKTQLTRIVASDAEVLFVPQYYNEIHLIVRQARELGWKGPIVGSDSWGTAETVELCGKDCHGLFFCTHYAAAGAKGATKVFIDRYEKQYGYVPDDVAALTWDALRIAQKAIETCGHITGDMETDRRCVRDSLARISEFKGITGRMTFTEYGDPLKCAVIVKINDKGEFEFYKSMCP